MATILAAAPLQTKESIDSLAGTLSHLNIAVYPTNQVEGFKKKYLRQMLWRRLKPELRQMVGYLVAFIVCAWLSFRNEIPLTQRVIFGFVAFITLVGPLVITTLDMGLIVLSSGWEVKGVLAGSRDIRKRMRKTSLKIAAALPAATFEVESCYIDPFLWVSYSGQRYCIDHWDLPFVDR